MPWPVHPNGLLGASGNDSDTYKIERSLRFNTNDSAYLTRNQTTPTTSGTFTLSCWVKRGVIGTDQAIFYGGSVRGTGQPGSNLYFLATGALGIDNSTGTANYTLYTSPGFLRDPSAWYHIVFNQTGATVNVYVNGVLFWNTTTTASNYFNSGVLHYIGTGGISNPITNFLSAYLAEMHFVDGQVLTPSSFGETDAVTGRWKAKAYSGTYGANGFYLKFADNSGVTAATLGKDSSPNGNNLTPVNLSVTAGVGNDSLVDSPTNYGNDSYNITVDNARGNYNTFNPLSKVTTATLTNGNLDAGASAIAIGSIGMSSGKWYWEITSTGGATAVGMYSASATSTRSVAAGATEGFRFDSVAGTLDYTTNGSTFTSIATGLTSIPYFIYASTAAATTASLNCGQRLFSYTMPSGYKTLCTTKLPTPTIKKPSSYFDALEYTGTGASNSISSLGFSPDLVWIKNRGTATSHAIYDTTRGTQSQLSSDTTGDQVTSSTGLTAFGSNGFTIGTSTLVNTSGTQYVSWAWDEASIAGMDIVSYTGNGANQTIAHNLGVAPKMIIAKARTTAGADQGWPVFHASIANTTYLQLNSTGGTAAGADYWNSTSPTSSVFSVGTNAAVNTSADTYIAYAFAEVEGFSKIGSYVGNGSEDGPFVWCGFRPRLIISKRIDFAENWIMHDTARDFGNFSQAQLQPNTPIKELLGNTLIDFISNGFKLRSTSSVNGNSTGGTHIFIAFAESPFKYSRAR